jgi:outer membrane receptor protein involved in Fe transport
MNTRARVLLLSSVTVAIAAAFPALAQTSGASGASEPASQVITVTATKRNERITDVPLAVTAIGEAEIRDRGAVDIRDLQYSVPGLNIQEQSPGAFRIQLRGINPGAGTGLPIVGTYVDEVGITIDQQQRDGPFPLVDLARIEVLRGPQGTLYGEGSMAGTIRYITRNPSLTKSGGFVEANLFQTDGGGLSQRVNAAVGVPLVEGKAGMRVAAGYDKLAGWVDYPQIAAKDANSARRMFVRPKLLIQPSEALTVTLLYQRYEADSDTDNYSSLADPSVRQRKELFPGKDHSDLANAVIQYNLGPATLTSSTGYQKRDLLFAASLSGGALKAVFDSSFSQWSQELRVSSNGDGPLQYTAGVWMRKFDSTEDRSATLNGAPFAPLKRLGDGYVDSKSSAVFGEVTWKSGPRVEFTAGGRYYRDERSTGSVVPATATQRADFNAFSPRLSARYEWSRNTSTYVTVSKGFRSGGFNGNGTSFGPESLWNYELGTKAILMGGSLFFDGAVYYADYKDRQAQAAQEIAPGVFQALTRNVGKASGPGVEVALSGRLGAGLELTATVGWNGIRNDSSNVEVLKGEAFDLVSAMTSSLALSQRFAVAAGLTGLWRVDYQHADPYSQRVRQAQANGVVATLQDFRSKAQDYVNLRAGVEGKDWSLTLDVKNALNKRPMLFPVVPLSQSQEGVHAVPRSIGLTLRKSFGS